MKDPFSASPSRHSFGHYVNVETIPGGRRVVHCHNWGRGLSDIVASIKTGINDLKKANAERDLEPLPIVVIIGWAGNDVYGEAGYAACSWVYQKRYLKTEREREVAAAWPGRQRQRVEYAVSELIGL